MSHTNSQNHDNHSSRCRRWASRHGPWHHHQLPRAGRADHGPSWACRAGNNHVHSTCNFITSNKKWITDATPPSALLERTEYYQNIICREHIYIYDLFNFGNHLEAYYVGNITILCFWVTLFVGYRTYRKMKKKNVYLFIYF